MYLFDYLGAVYFWLYLLALSIIKGKSWPSFSEVVSGKGRHDEESFVDLNAYGLKLKIVGVVVTGILLKIFTEL